MESKMARQGSNIVEIVIIIAILALANWLGYKFFKRLDMTATKQYTVSQATKDVLGKLDDPVNAEFFLSRDLPPELMSIRDDIKDRLAEYTAYSKGKLRIKYTDPGDDEKEKERATGLGVQEQQFQVAKKDQLQVVKAFFGLVLTYADKSEALSIQDLQPDSLEYAMTSRLLRVTQKEKPRIAFFEGSMNFNQQQGQQNQGPTYDALNQVLSGEDGLYEVVKLDPSKDKVLPEDIKAVMICGAFGLSDSLKYSIDQYLMNGGQVLIALDPMMQAGGQMGQPSQAFPSLPTMEDQIEKYGIKFDKKLIVDSACANVQMRMGPIPISVPYPLWPQVGPEGMNKDISAISKLESVTVPWSCPLNDQAHDGEKFQVLLSSSAKSFLISSPFNLDPQQDWDFLKTSSEKSGPFHLAYLVSGKIPSAFDGPPAPKAPAPGEPAPDEQLFNASAHIKEANDKSRLMVVSSAMTFSDNMIQRYQENGLFAANVVDMLALGDELAGIRSAPVTSRPLKQLTDAQKSSLRWVNVLGVPLLLVGFGFLLWFLRGKRRAALQKYFAS